ncbi:MAG: hypothetical protein IPN44_03590 [Flavobacteriales bacterium]|nr:hypothetical protein [Flavobacteriales bacterium]
MNRLLGERHNRSHRFCQPWNAAAVSYEVSLQWTLIHAADPVDHDDHAFNGIDQMVTQYLERSIPIDFRTDLDTCGKLSEVA